MRSGLTLIELLVVMFIIVMVAGLGIYLMPKLQSEKGSRGAQDIQGALMQAKYRALRDKTPKGIRLIPDPADPSKCRSYVFIEQPEDWAATTISANAQAPNPNTVYTVTGGDLTGGLPDKTLWPVQPGDYLYVGKALRGIVQDMSATTITVLGDPLAVAITSTNRGTNKNWWVVRGPRPIPGEEVINFPDGVAVDLDRYWGPAPYNVPLTNLGQPTGPYDIMFSPSGSVAGRYATQGQIYLWVRDTTRTLQNTNDPGEQIVIVVYTRSGQIGAYPVDTTNGADPLSFRNDPKFRPSGL